MSLRFQRLSWSRSALHLQSFVLELEHQLGTWSRNPCACCSCGQQTRDQGAFVGQRVCMERPTLHHPLCQALLYRPVSHSMRRVLLSSF